MTEAVEPDDGLTESDRQMIARLNKTLESMETKVPALKALVYGNSGVGKTVESMAILQRIVPKDQRIMFFDTGEGWSSLQNHPQLKVRVDRFLYKGVIQIEAVIDLIRRKVGPYANYGGLQLDEYSSMADTALDKVTRDRAAKDSNKDPDSPMQPDYKVITNQFGRLTTNLVSLSGVHVILVAHERVDKASNNLLVTSPLFLPSASAKIRQAMNLVAYMSATEVTNEQTGDLVLRRTLQVHPANQISAKTRIGGLNTIVTHKELMPVMLGWLGGTVADVEPQVAPTIQSTDNADDTEGVTPITENGE